MGFQVFLKFVNGAVHSDIDWQIIPDCWCCHFKSPITPVWFWPALEIISLVEMNEVHVWECMVVQH